MARAEGVETLKEGEQEKREKKQKEDKKNNQKTNVVKIKEEAEK